MLDSETTEREAQKNPHESLIKIFYKHRVTEVGRDLWSSSGPIPPKAQPT